MSDNSTPNESELSISNEEDENDTDFVVDDDDTVEEYDEDDYDECEYDEDEGNDHNNIMFIISNPDISNYVNSRKRSSKEEDNNQTNSKKSKFNDITDQYNKPESEYFNTLSDTEKQTIYDIEHSLNDTETCKTEPLRFKFLRFDISPPTKNYILAKTQQLNKMTHGSGEYSKLNNWLTELARIPFGKISTLPINNNSDIASYLETVKSSFDLNVYGHNDTKNQIIRVLAQWVSNPNSNGCVIGIQGPPGVGKTKLVKDGICKAMNFPLAFISLGGMSDSSYLNGHNYTYEGATYGKIVECLMKAKTMNPVFLFDELDKVSDTSKGEEIINTLIHITDPVQNDRYTDKYFEEISIDLSKSIMIFTYNDIERINPILRDRMITLSVSGYDSNEKLTLCKMHLLPELYKQYNFESSDVIFTDMLLKEIIEKFRNDDGVRNLKRELNNILSHINTMRYVKTDDVLLTLPFSVSQEFYNKYCVSEEPIVSKPMLSMYI